MVSLASPICGGCAHLHGDLLDPKCDAFPSGIPWPVLLSERDHRMPYADDLGVRFEPKTPKDAEYAEEMFRMS